MYVVKSIFHARWVRESTGWLSSRALSVRSAVAAGVEPLLLCIGRAAVQTTFFCFIVTTAVPVVLLHMYSVNKHATWYTHYVTAAAGVLSCPNSAQRTSNSKGVAVLQQGSSELLQQVSNPYVSRAAGQTAIDSSCAWSGFDWLYLYRSLLCTRYNAVVAVLDTSMYQVQELLYSIAVWSGPTVIIL